MKAIPTLTDAGGHTIAEHVDHLRRSLDSFGRKLRDAVSVAVGETVSGTVQAALRAALADLAGLSPAAEEARQVRYGPPPYWGEPDEWGGPGYASDRGPPPSDVDDRDPHADSTAGSRWPMLAFVGGRLLAAWLRRIPEDRRWLTAAGVGVVAALAVVAGLPGVGLLRSTAALTSLADVLRGGAAAVSQLTP
ncbi:MAG TPA: hypothetical protein VGF55_13210 [Gemmataceae bacterium]|jgi:hypothetical protein